VVRIVKHVFNDGKVNIELWDDFDSLKNILSIQLNAKVVDNLEGIYSRYCTFEMDNIPFGLIVYSTRRPHLNIPKLFIQMMPEDCR